MKINEIIRQRRKALGLTQEQIAQRLGVSAPAVNKWESGVSYPDITLLPPLARLLKIDLNTLLSFKEELTEAEIADLVRELTQVIQTGQVEAALIYAREQAEEYPSCLPLLYALASVLKSCSMLLSEHSEEADALIRQWLEQCAQGEDGQVRDGAIGFLFLDALKQEQFEEARQLLNRLPQPPMIDKQQLQVNLYLRSKETEKALEMMERRLIKTATDLSMQLGTLANLTIKDHPETAQRYLQLCRWIGEQLDLMPYNLAYADWTAATDRQDSEAALAALEAMFQALKTPWIASHSALYPHIQDQNDMSTFGALLSQSLLKALQQDETMQFLRQSPRYEQVLRKLHEITESHIEK